MYNKLLLLFCYTLLAGFSGLAQKPPFTYSDVTSSTKNSAKQHAFIENIGQYGNFLPGYEDMGEIKFGYEGFDMPVLFTAKGLIHLHRRINPITHEQEEKFEKQGLPEEEIERKKTITDKTVRQQWSGANEQAVILPGKARSDYHTYWMQQGKAAAYETIIYKDIYPGIDVVYSFRNDDVPGFEYSFIVHPGADPAQIKLKYEGDVKSVKLTKDGIHIKTEVNEITESVPNAWYADDSTHGTAPRVNFSLSGREAGFVFSNGYDKTKTLVIDPFVSNISVLTGINAGKAKDIDFDYEGNIYVTGGGDGNTSHMLAKYNASGVLQWTFSGVLTLPAWNFGPYFGGWVVDKSSGSIYMGQGFDFNTGFIVVRLTTTGLYDNFTTVGNPNFRENWKMIWNCNAGSPQIIVAGGGTNSDINLGLFSPPSTFINGTNITGISGIAFQDMADMVIDPLTNSMYTLYASGSVPSLNNALYKHNQPYSPATKIWNVATGYTVLQEAANRPYFGGTGLQENSVNVLAVNASYLFYWDGRNLKAFDKVSGAVVGTALTITTNASQMQGGIVADACNNIYVGSSNGTIKVYKFNGSIFDDAAAPDITVSGYESKPVYDLAYNEQHRLIYACGDGFVASFDVSPYCANTTYTINVAPDCSNGNIVATVSPVPPAGSLVNFILFNGATQIASNTTGIFNGLIPQVNYTVVATINQACSGSQANTNFIMPGPVLNVTVTNTSCGSSTGSISATGSGTLAPYTYSIDGIIYQASGNFTNLPGAVYIVSVKDGGGCKTSDTVTIANSNGPIISFSATNATCGNNTGSVTINASGGTAPYQYSSNGITYQSSNVINGLTGGIYSIRVKDVTGCVNTVLITILSGATPLLTAIPSSATCGNNNGSITVFGTGGFGALQYSINGNTFQASGVFTNLSPGSYTVTVRDASGCIKTASVTVDNNPAPTLTATSNAATCTNANGAINANATGGVAPLQYSIDGSAYQSTGTFLGLTAGVYTVSVHDAVGCIRTLVVTVASTNGPTVTATTVSSTCGASNGTVTAAATGGIPPYQYSINGLTYQAAVTFTGLGPGNYIVYVKDNAGCINGVAVVLSNISGPSVTATANPSSCNINDGTITATGSGGTGPYQFSINGVVFQGSGLFSGLAPTIYTVTVKDALNCIKTTTITVPNSAGLIMLLSNISSSCNGSNGTITASASGGATPYQFSLNNISYQASGIFTNIAPGLYTVYVKDANGCIISRTTTVLANLAPVLSLSVTNSNCGGSNGLITATGSSGTPPLQFNIDGGAYQSIASFPGLTAATHTVTVRDAAGCITSQTAIVVNIGSGAPPTDVTFTIRNVLSCTGGTGKIKNLKGIPSGGGNSYTFSLDGGAFTTSNQFTNVLPGTHTITAKNENGCTVTKVAVLTNVLQATANATAVATACNTTNGSITITGVGPNTPYHASINGVGGPWVTFFPPGANTLTFAGLAPGGYTIIMADDGDFTAGTPDIPGACLSFVNVAVPSLGGPTLSTTVTPGNCFSPNGSVLVTGAAGTAPYTYNINGGAYQAGATFSNLAPGSYVFGVQDAAGCVNAVSATVPVPASPSVTATVISEACGSANGSITLTGSGGTAPYQYSINGFTFQASATFTNLSAGTYQVTIKDVNGCYGTLTTVVGTATRPSVTAFSLAAACNTASGTLIANGTGGTIPYQYSIDGVLFQSSGTFAGLAPGAYTIYIKDNRGCTNLTNVTVSATASALIATAVTAAKCNNANGIVTVTATGGAAPLQYSLDGITYQAGNSFTSIVSGDYTVSVMDAVGCISTKLVLVSDNPGPHTLTSTIVHASCGLSNGSIIATGSGGTAPLQYSINGVSYQASGSFAAVSAGSYTLFVKDANGCIYTTPFTVANLAGPTASAVSTPATCTLNDGSITVSASGGTGVLSYSINGVTYQSSNVFTGLPAGTYTVTVKDTRLCMATTSVTVNPFVVPTASALTADAACGIANGSITVTANGGSAPYQYSLDGITYQAGNVFNNLSAGTYLVRIRDVNNCSGTVTVILHDSAPLNGVYIVGSGGDFSTLTSAVHAYNTQCIAGPITFLLIDGNYSVNETFPIIINSNIYASSINTLSIKPAAGIDPVIEADDINTAIQFNGADYIIIDGSNTFGGTTKNLFIKNIHAPGKAVFWLNSADAFDAATHITVKNCIISGAGAASTSAGIMSSGSVFDQPAESPNEYNTIEFNSITAAARGIVLTAPGSGEHNNVIHSNTIGSALAADKLSETGILIMAEQDCEIRGNEVLGVNGNSSLLSGISILAASAFVSVGGNTIHDIKNVNATGAGANGIYLASSSANAAIQVYNNIISDVAANGTTNSREANSNGYGLMIDGGAGYDIYHNSIILSSNQFQEGYPAAINISSAVTATGAINIKNNIFGNEQTQAGDHYTIQCTAAIDVIASIDYNDFYNLSGALGFIGSNRLTLTDIRNSFGSNLNSINVRPAYVSATDFHIDPANVSNGVNLGDRGTTVGISIDYDKTTRNALTPDIGADEWLRPNYGSWVGKINTDWLVPENWETNVVPDGTTDVTITGGYTHMPTIATIQEVRDLNLSAPDISNTPILTLSGGSIQVNGNINYSGGTIDGLHGTLVMNGTDQQEIPAGLFAGNALNNLVIANNTAQGVTSNGALDIYQSLTFTATGKRFNTSDSLTFKSTDTVTAWLGNMTGKLITGKATVERRIPNHSKTWQFLSTPTVGQTVKESWQEGSSAPNSNPVPGFGTQITSNVLNATVHPSPGYDLSSPNGPSLKVYNASTNGYDAIASTADPVYNAKGYMLFVRGDRSVTTFGAPATATTLRTKGQLFTPANPPPVINVNGGLPPNTFESVGNPYPSAIDLTQLTLNEAGGGVQDVFYVWDPHLTSATSSAYGLGGFQVLTRNGTTYDVTPGGGSYGSTNRFIQSGQAFFVNAPFTSGTVTFTEDCKVNGSDMVNRMETTSAWPQLRSNLYLDNNGAPILLDGNLLQYDQQFADSLDILDALKIKNTGENFGISSNNKILMVEKRKPIRITDTIFFQLSQLKLQTYTMEFVAFNVQQPGLAAFLEDNYLHSSTIIGLNDTTRVHFTVSTDTGSYMANRFRIVFQQLDPTPVIFSNLTAVRNPDKSVNIHWTVENELNIRQYVTEHSADGRNFSDLFITTALANNGSVAGYQQTDQQPFAKNNYYRIRAEENSGFIQYSNIAVVGPLKLTPGIVLYPNPVTDRKLQLHFTDMPTGEYFIYVMNQAGQYVMNASIATHAEEEVKTIALNNTIAAGVYKLTILHAKGIKTVLQLIVQ
ncbi:MAG: T9SS type A sorting domain-containing protein [Bacteroidetes bacterium]|nr:T9SS type A sorting domain-containing protein [Bacteroidota bacterium]